MMHELRSALTEWTATHNRLQLLSAVSHSMAAYLSSLYDDPVHLDSDDNRDDDVDDDVKLTAPATVSAITQKPQLSTRTDAKCAC